MYFYNNKTIMCVVSYYFDFMSYENIIENKYYFITALYIVLLYIYFAVCQRIRYECTKSWFFVLANGAEFIISREFQRINSTVMEMVVRNLFHTLLRKFATIIIIFTIVILLFIFYNFCTCTRLPTERYAQVARFINIRTRKKLTLYTIGTCNL